MADIEEIRRSFKAFVEEEDWTRPFLIWKSESGARTTVDVYLAPGFVRQVHSRRRELRKDPQQLWKALRNTRRGYSDAERHSGGGRDGIFDLDSKRFQNDMTVQLEKVIDDDDLMSSLRAQYPFVEGPWRPVRVVAHPNNVRVRPVGLLALDEDGTTQSLVLVALAIYGTDT